MLGCALGQARECAGRLEHPSGIDGAFGRDEEKALEAWRVVELVSVAEQLLAIAGQLGGGTLGIGEV